MNTTDAQDAGLLRCPLPCAFPQPPRERLVKPFRLPADPQGADQVVGVAAHQRLASTLGFDHLFNPQVQRLVQVDVGDHGRDAAALWDTGIRVDHPAVRLPNARLQPLPEQAQKGPVIDPHAQHLQQPVLVHVVEEAFDVGRYHIPVPPLLPVKGQVADRLPGPALGAVPITPRQNLLLLERLQDSGAGGLQALVVDRRNA